MSEQAKILAEMQALIMKILQNGSASVEEGDKLDELEDLLNTQRCFKEAHGSEYACIGEEITSLFFKDAITEAIDKMCEYGITPEDFFGFADYYYDEGDMEEFVEENFTPAFITSVNKDYELKCQSK